MIKDGFVYYLIGFIFGCYYPRFVNWLKGKIKNDKE